MKDIMFKFVCDQCGKQIIFTSDEDDNERVRLIDAGWAEIVNSDYLSDGREFHFCSHKHYKKFDKAHPDMIDCKASFYAAQEWFK